MSQALSVSCILHISILKITVPSSHSYETRYLVHKYELVELLILVSLVFVR